MTEQLHSQENLEQTETEKKPISGGFSNWQKAARDMGSKSLARFIESMDPGDAPQNMNAHTAIARRLEALRLPIQKYISLAAGEFLCEPEEYFAQISDGDYYFMSIRPGLHLAHAEDEGEIVDFVKQFVHHDMSDAGFKKSLEKDIYISHNGNPALSGHVVVDKDSEPNAVQAEFTNGNFNMFHRGLSTPEIIVRRSGQRFEWGFQGDLAADGDWRDETETFECYGGARLSRPEMARRIFGAISQIPHDGDRYMPGYYEILLEDQGENRTRPAFIEAVV